MRCVLIPKQDGSLRPISVTSIAWRVGVSAVLQHLQEWMDLWLPPYLLGGLKARGVREAHELLHHDVLSAINSDRFLTGAKLDVRKCFDSVLPCQVLTIWQHLGAPMEVVRLLDHFYQFSLRRFETKDAVARNESGQPGPSGRGNVHVGNYGAS